MLLLQVVLSSAFETDLGLSYNARVAAAVESLHTGSDRVYHGLGTSNWFAENIWPSVPLHRGALPCSDLEKR